MSIWASIKSYFDLTSNGKASRERFLADQETVKEPWAAFEVIGFENDGRVKIEFNWNTPFAEKIRELGFHAETEEDSVQLFFYTSQMRPMSLASGDDTVQSADLPQLSSQQNIIRT